MSFKPCIEPQYPSTRDALPLLIVGEAPGEEEEQSGIPFVGASGRVLDSWLRMKEIERQQVTVTNVFLCRPKNNEIARFFVRHNDPEATTRNQVPRFRGSKLVREELFENLVALRNLIHKMKPRVILAVGSTALWATYEYPDKMRDLVGKPLDGKFCAKGYKVVPVFHPSYLLRGGDAAYAKTALDAVATAKGML